MGTSFDFMDPQSGKNGQISATQHINREQLNELMKKRGFRRIDSEWWHFTYKKESFSNIYFDFNLFKKREPSKNSQSTNQSQTKNSSNT